MRSVYSLVTVEDTIDITYVKAPVVAHERTVNS